MAGFIRKQEEKLAIRLLAWQYERHGRALHPYPEMQRLARKLVDDAHRIARERGRNVVSILKELINEDKRE